MRYPHRWAAAVAALVAVTLAAGACGRGNDRQERQARYGTLNPRADFTLTDQDGKPFHLSDHRGQVVLLFFGYLSCPDVCPSTLSKLAAVYSSLGSALKPRVLTAFVSFDTRRDAPEKLKQYLSYFGVNGVGLTGSQAEVDAVMRTYGASYVKVETRSALGYLYNHSDMVYLINGRGRVEDLFHSDATAESITKSVQAALSP